MTSKNITVLIPQPIRKEAVNILENKGYNVIQPDDDSRKNIASLIDKSEAVILRSGIKMDKELMENAENLMTISRTGAGVDNIDLTEATRKGVIVTSSLGVNTSSVAEHCLALILNLYKQIPLLDRNVRENNFAIRYENHPQDIKNKILGVVGFGRIGRKVADFFQKISQENTLVYDPYLSEAEKENYQDRFDFLSLEKVLSNSDIVSLHVPLTDDTYHLITKRHFEIMKREAYIVNVSRGDVIKEDDLILALEEDLIAGAGLDVFSSEPPKENNPLLNMENVILTPHAAALTEECVVNMATEAVKRAIDVLEGEKPAKIANPEVIEQKRWKDLR